MSLSNETVITLVVLITVILTILAYACDALTTCCSCIQSTRPQFIKVEIVKKEEETQTEEIGKVEISETQQDQTKKSDKSNSKNTDPTPSAPPATDDQQFYDCELYVENELPKKKPKAGFVNPSSSSRTNFSSAPCVPQKDEYVESLKLITQVLGETEELRLKERVEKASGGLRTDKVYIELNGILTQKLEQLDRIAIPSNVKSRLKIRVARENCVGMIEELLLKLDAKYPEHSLLEGGGCGDVFTTKAE